jgi:hypothetical protein
MSSDATLCLSHPGRETFGVVVVYLVDHHGRRLIHEPVCPACLSKETLGRFKKMMEKEVAG